MAFGIPSSLRMNPLPHHFSPPSPSCTPWLAVTLPQGSSSVLCLSDSSTVLLTSRATAKTTNRDNCDASEQPPTNRDET